MRKKLLKTFILLGILAVLTSPSYAQFSTVVETSVANVTGNSAVLQALVNPNGYISTMWFEYGTDSNLYTWSDTEHLAIDDVNYAIPFARTTSGLRPNTPYYFRAVVDNGRNETKGDIFYFVTTQGSQSNTVVNNSGTTNNTSATTSVNTTNNTNNTDTTNDSSLSLTANALFAGGFLPNSFLGWLILISILVAILFVLKKIVGVT